MRVAGEFSLPGYTRTYLTGLNSLYVKSKPDDVELLDSIYIYTTIHVIT